MLITVAAIGRLKDGPERELCERYLSRASAAGRALGLTFATRELAESRATSPAARKTQEATALLDALPAGAAVIALDEGGRSVDSRALAERVAHWRDDGIGTLAFVIGGPDGHGQALLDRAALRLAFGAMTWPHQLVRIMVFEQLYRTVTILSGHPYHRD